MRQTRVSTDFEVFRDGNPEFTAQISALRVYRDRELGKLALPQCDRRNYVRRLLADRKLHLLYAYEAVRKKRQLGQATPESIRELASRCNPFQPTSERIVTVATGVTRQRIVANYGPLKRMHQLLVADIILKLHPPLEQQFLFRGGMPAALNAVEAAFLKGFRYGVEVDFINFYGSVRASGLAELLWPLPKSVVEHVVWDATSRSGVVSDIGQPDPMSWAHPSLNGQTGLALGSACSPIVAERILGNLATPAEYCRVIAYADNFIVLGRSPRFVRAYCNDLSERAVTLADWSLRPRMPTTPAPRLDRHQVPFLHQILTIRDSNFSWSPDERKIDQYLLAHTDDVLNLEEIDQLEAKITHWRRAYPDWPEGDIFEIEQLAALAARRYYLAATPLNRIRASQMLVASYIAQRRLVTLEEILPGDDFGQVGKRRITLLDDAYRQLLMLEQ